MRWWTSCSRDSKNTKKCHFKIFIINIFLMLICNYYNKNKNSQLFVCFYLFLNTITNCRLIYIINLSPKQIRNCNYKVLVSLVNRRGLRGKVSPIRWPHAGWQCHVTGDTNTTIITFLVFYIKTHFSFQRS